MVLDKTDPHFLSRGVHQVLNLRTTFWAHHEPHVLPRAVFTESPRVLPVPPRRCLKWPYLVAVILDLAQPGVLYEAVGKPTDKKEALSGKDAVQKERYRTWKGRLSPRSPSLNCEDPWLPQSQGLETQRLRPVKRLVNSCEVSYPLLVQEKTTNDSK